MFNQANYELHFKVLALAQQVSDQGPTMVDDWRVTERKRIFSLLVESFRSFSAFSRLLREHYYVQSCSVLRMFVEQVTKFLLLVQHKDLYDIYVRHCQVRESIIDLPTSKERKKAVMSAFGLGEKQYSSALSYLDYGWARSVNKDGSYGYHEMLKMVWTKGNILAWIDKLDQFVHQNLDSNSLTQEGFLLFEEDNIYLGTVVFESLFVELMNRLETIIPPSLLDLFKNRFWPEYEKLLQLYKPQA